MTKNDLHLVGRSKFAQQISGGGELSTSPAVATDAIQVSGGGKIAPAIMVPRFSPLVLALIAILALLILPPVIYLLRSSLQQTNFDGSLGAFTLRYYRDLLQTDRLLPVIATSAAYAGGSALVALLLGGIQAWIVERTDTPLRALVMIVSILSLGIPTVLYTISFLLLLGKTGPLNQLLMWATGADIAPFNVYS